MPSSHARSAPPRARAVGTKAAIPLATRPTLLSSFSAPMKLRSGLDTCPEAPPPWDYSRDARYVPDCVRCKFPVEPCFVGYPDECDLCRAISTFVPDEDTPRHVYEEVASLTRYIRQRAQHYIETGKMDLERGDV